MKNPERGGCQVITRQETGMKPQVGRHSPGVAEAREVVECRATAQAAPTRDRGSREVSVVERRAPAGRVCVARVGDGRESDADDDEAANNNNDDTDADAD